MEQFQKYKPIDEYGAKLRTYIIERLGYDNKPIIQPWPAHLTTKLLLLPVHENHTTFTVDRVSLQQSGSTSWQV